MTDPGKTRGVESDGRGDSVKAVSRMKQSEGEISSVCSALSEHSTIPAIAAALRLPISRVRYAMKKLIRRGDVVLITKDSGNVAATFRPTAIPTSQPDATQD